MNAVPEPYRRHRLSVDDYHRMGEAGIFAPDSRIELINGEIIDMAPIGNRHMSTVDRLNKWLVLAVGDRAIVRVQGSVRLDAFSEPEPDLLLLRPRADYYADGSAGPSDVLLLIEVSQSSLRYDNEVKLPLYASVEIPEVWIIDIAGRQLNRHAVPVGGRWTVEESPENLDAIVPRKLREISLDLSTLFG